jgi:transglutaminase-like putative cysteine protease
VPYRGVDEWTRITIVLGGTLLPAVAAALAFWPRAGGRTGYPGAALVLLVALYVTPAVALGFPGEFVRGAVLTVLVLAFLRLERIPLRDAPGAAMAAAAVAVVALLAAPVLDRDEPWWDYETWALSAAESKSTTFSWEHEYGPLDWPRDGREVLRVKARQPAYWKAENLDFFDGRRWLRGQPFGMREVGAWDQLPGDLTSQARWAQTIGVSIRNMRTRTFVTAGTAMGVEMPRRMTLHVGGGVYTSTGTLRRGDAYSARVYTPRPGGRALTRSGTSYEPWLQWYRAVVLPDRRTPTPGPDDRSVLMLAPPFGDDGGPVARVRYAQGVVPARGLIRGTDLERSYRLARELREQSATPYGFVKRVERHLRDGFSYTETPDERAGTLDGFLFESRAGYCQQFSGAMALLLRLGGVPARVATGFTSGSFDEDAKEWVVRDMDAHSWVEVWFPDYGWVPFDPTPVDAPPRSQARGDRSATAAVGDVADLGTGSPLDPRASAVDDPARPSRLPLLFGLGALALAAGAAVVAVRRQGAVDGVDELERALRRAGAAPAPGTTLRGLERHFSAYPAAAAYVRAVREQRYGGHGAGAPTKSQRNGLREAISGDGPIGRLRGWWALPPRRR